MNVIESLKGLLAVRHAVDATGASIGAGWDPKKSLAKGVPLFAVFVGGLLVSYIQADPSTAFTTIVRMFDVPVDLVKPLVAVLVFGWGYWRNRSKTIQGLVAKGAVAVTTTPPTPVATAEEGTQLPPEARE